MKTKIKLSKLCYKSKDPMIFYHCHVWTKTVLIKVTERINMSTGQNINVENCDIVTGTNMSAHVQE